MRPPSVRDPKTLSLFACLFIVLLRFAIGWQFVYEGLWKLHSQNTPVPWSAVGYLNNAQGPYRDQFRHLIDDPEELRWLDYDKMVKSWEDWSRRFENHYQLSDKQKEELAELINGPDTKSVGGVDYPTLPESGGKISFSGTPIKYDADKKTMSFSTDTPPTPRDLGKIYAQLGDEADEEADENKQISDEEQRFRDQLRNLQRAAADLSPMRELAGRLKGDPEVTGVVFVEEVKKGEQEFQNRPKEGKEDHIIVVGDKQVYLDMIDDYNRKLAVADQDFEFDHLQTMWQKIQAKKNSLVAPIKQLDKDLKADALKLLTYEQLARGPVPHEKTELYQINWLTIWSLLILGGCLMIGLFTRIAAVAGAGMLMTFYLVWPPWPGVPAAPGPEHEMFINKNAIEALALMAIAFMPTSGWFGLDGLICALFRRKGK